MANKIRITNSNVCCKYVYILESDQAPVKAEAADVKTEAKDGDQPADKDNSFRSFRCLCADIAEENGYIGKTKILSDYITQGSSGGNEIFMMRPNVIGCSHVKFVSCFVSVRSCYLEVKFLSCL